MVETTVLQSICCYCRAELLTKSQTLKNAFSALLKYSHPLNFYVFVTTKPHKFIFYVFKLFL